MFIMALRFTSYNFHITKSYLLIIDRKLVDYYLPWSFNRVEDKYPRIGFVILCENCIDLNV